MRNTFPSIDRNARTFIILAVIWAMSFLFLQNVQAETPEDLLRKEKEVREQMQILSRQLGVTCASCHDTRNYKSSKKPLYPISLEHMKITQVLIDQGFDGKNGKPKADCYMCHRGKLSPDYKERVHPMTEIKKSNEKKPEDKEEFEP